MTSGLTGIFVVAWAQTEIDGIPGAPATALALGATWRRSGDAVRVDGPSSILVLDDAEARAEMQRRARRVIARLLGPALRNPEQACEDDTMPDADEEQGFTLTDGRHSYHAGIAGQLEGRGGVVVFTGDLPPIDRDLWVTGLTGPAPAPLRPAEGEGVICFTPGTLIDAPGGPRAIETLGPGDRIATRDNGDQEILWVGRRRMTGARLHAMPHLRPVRIRPGALGEGRPGDDLLVSPRHRMLVTGALAESLFNAPEVLVAAEDLVNDRSIVTDHACRSVDYIHILLERHQIVRANGLDTESFHPGVAALDMIEDAQRAALFGCLPDLEGDPMRYGDFARRMLSRSEAAILRFAGA